jgi:uncharacterized membrane protein
MHKRKEILAAPTQKNESTSNFSGFSTVHELTQKNIETVMRLEDASKNCHHWTENLANRITSFCGSVSYVLVHIVWYSAWLAWNLLAVKEARFDPFPFSLLTLIVSLEAIFLSTFILISQNQQTKLSDRRAHLDLQVNLLSEQENTKMLELLSKIAAKLGVADSGDKEIKAMSEAIQPEQLARQIEKGISMAEATGADRAQAEPVKR